VTSNPKSPSSDGFFARLRSRLNRGASWLTGDMGVLLGGHLDAATLEGLEEQLLMADVGVEATERVLDSLRSRARSEASVDIRACLIAAVVELLLPLEQNLVIDRNKSPFVILMVGVNGTGKTTSIGKLAHRLKQSGLSVLLAAGDTFRAAAVEQLQEWGERAGVPVVAQAPGADPAAVIHDALHAAQARGVDVVLADTAGRLHTSGGLMDELDKIKRVASRFDSSAPHEVLLVLDASQGQNALAQAIEFHARLGLTGLILTKLDGSAKGGITLAIAEKLQIPIRFIAVGETIEDFDVFDAREFVTAMIGTDGT